MVAPLESLSVGKLVATMARKLVAYLVEKKAEKMVEQKVVLRDWPLAVMMVVLWVAEMVAKRDKMMAAWRVGLMVEKKENTLVACLVEKLVVWKAEHLVEQLVVWLVPMKD